MNSLFCMHDCTISLVFTPYNTIHIGDDNKDGSMYNVNRFIIVCEAQHKTVVVLLAVTCYVRTANVWYVNADPEN